MDAFLQDLRYAFRHIRRSPGFATAAILTLALGIGANTAMFSMLSALTLKRLPVADPDGLIGLMPRTSRGTPRSTPVSAVDELSRGGPLDPLCGYLGGIVVPVLANGSPVQTMTTFVTGRCFSVFGVAPIMGRTITDADAPIHSQGAHVAVISYRLWTTAFNADPTILGRTVQVNNVAVEIIGVLPRGFVGLEVDYGVDIFTTFDSVLRATAGRRQLASVLLGRLRAGITLEQAEAELRTRWPAMLEVAVPATLPPTERATFRDSIPRLQRLGTGLSTNRERYVQPLTLIFGLTTLLLVLACVNLGGLLLARLTARSAELAVRLALGGTRWRVMRQMVIESLLLSLSGAVLAVPVAYSVVVTLASFMPPANVSYAMSFTPDLTVLAVTSVIGVAVGLVMSALPMWVAMRRNAGTRFTWDRTVTGTTSRWGRGLLVAQVALSMVMLVGAALLSRSLYLLQHADLGVRTAGILDVKLFGLPNAPYNRGQREAYYPPLVDKVAALPSVQSVALAEVFPRGRSSARAPIALVGDEIGDLTAANDQVSPGFFETMGIPVLAGRVPLWSDSLQTRHVAVVSESLARALRPDGDVVDRHVKFGSLPADQDIAIVGIVADSTQGDPRNARPRVLYRAILQTPVISASNPNILIATSDPAAVAASVTQILREGGQDYAQEIISVDAVLARAPSSERMSATLGGAVGGLAVLLALVGVHGTLAYAVSRRTREIGVRVAIGASPRGIAASVLREALLVTIAGVAIGLPLAYLAARTLRTLMFGITESDPLTFAGASLFFVALGLAAAIVPARRAARVDPMIALRSE